MAGYGSDGGFTAYATAAGYDIPVGSIPAARQRGSTYIDSTYGSRFVGKPTGGLDQEREWPRMGVPGFADNDVPMRVENAAYEAALIELREPGSLSAIISGTSLVKREKVEGAVEVEYAVSDKTDIAAAAQPVVTIIEGMLAPLLRKPMPGILVV